MPGELSRGRPCWSARRAEARGQGPTPDAARASAAIGSGPTPSAGFVAKLLVFKAAVSAQAYGLAVAVGLTSALGAYYYLRVVLTMYMRPPEPGEEPALSPALSVALAASAVAVVALGVGPEPIAALARAASGLGP